MGGVEFARAALERSSVSPREKAAYFIAGAVSAFGLTFGIGVGGTGSYMHGAMLAGPTLAESWMQFYSVRKWRSLPAIRNSVKLEDTLIEQTSKDTLETFSDLAYSLRDGAKAVAPWSAAGAAVGYGLASMIKQYF